MLNGAELGALPMPTVITDMENAKLGALRKLMVRVMEVKPAEEVAREAYQPLM